MLEIAGYHGEADAGSLWFAAGRHVYPPPSAARQHKRIQDAYMASYSPLKKMGPWGTFLDSAILDGEMWS